MKSAKRLGAIALLAASLATADLVLTPATALAQNAAAASTITLADACAKLADAIAFLEGRPASPLRDFLLAQARRLEVRYCS